MLISGDLHDYLVEFCDWRMRPGISCIIVCVLPYSMEGGRPSASILRSNFDCMSDAAGKCKEVRNNHAGITIRQKSLQLVGRYGG